MALSMQEVEKIKNEFMQAYFALPMNSCGISQVRCFDKNAADASDYCISVSLEKKLPQGVAIPNIYQGVRVFTKVTGPINAYDW